ncbi:unnamed protein product [Lactuca virosa]|uniref:Uncharacterized protein n=1 Tax=Lactuca virosa TaxID=75947 RepID=A0AAU9N318_9ASTR|nr:unnamed protein product [Lactuca virosa]
MSKQAQRTAHSPIEHQRQSPPIFLIQSKVRILKAINFWFFLLHHLQSSPTGHIFHFNGRYSTTDLALAQWKLIQYLAVYKGFKDYKFHFLPSPCVPKPPVSINKNPNFLPDRTHSSQGGLLEHHGTWGINLLLKDYFPSFTKIYNPDMMLEEV